MIDRPEGVQPPVDDAAERQNPFRPSETKAYFWRHELIHLGGWSVLGCGLGWLADTPGSGLAAVLGLYALAQLRRLFRKHLGAAPISVAQTRRVLLAKALSYPIETTVRGLARYLDGERIERVVLNRPAPEVFLKLDEFPADLLMTPERRIDAERYPAFARLAGPAYFSGTCQGAGMAAPYSR